MNKGIADQETCELCGLPGTLIDGHVRCVGHAGADSAEAQPTALYQEIRDLFPPVHGSAINLDLPDYLVEPVASTLRVILRLVTREGIVGKVLITRLEYEDGCLFVRVRYYDGLTDDHLGTRASINAMVGDLEAQADELVRKHQQGGSDAS